MPLVHICFACDTIGAGLQYSVPLIQLFEDENKVNAVDEADKPTDSKWLVDSGASIHVTDCKEDLNEPEATDQAVTISSGKVMATQFKGKRATLLVYMTGNTVELEDTLFIPGFKKKIVSLSKLLDQVYWVAEWTKTHRTISRNNRDIIIK